jgi:hypothetical protein
MKKTTVILIMSAILMMSVFPASLSASTSLSIGQTKAFTHTMFAELGTELPCSNCHVAREALHKVFTSNDYPFYYVTLVDFVDTAAINRIDEFNLWGYPTVWFDGGYRVELGGIPEAEEYYRQDLTDCGARAVPNIDLNLTATWLGNAQIDIDVNVLNYESSSYNGHIHVYVTEVESTMGWNDTIGHPYTFPLLDYAFNQDISIISSGTWAGSLIWDGYEHNNGQGNDFGNIQFGNLEVIAAVFNSDVHQGFSNPPNGNPFNAYYVDDAAGVWLGTPHPPAVPTNPNPVDGTTNVDVTKDISWTNSEHEDIGEDVYSDLYFGTTNPPPLFQTNIFETKYDVGLMQFHTKYYWKIVAHDNHGQITEGPIWSFTTASVPDSTPPTVTIEKPKSGFLYIQDNDGRQYQLLKNALIIGKITIEANATDTESGIDRISFLIDGKIQAEITTAPYTFVWTRFSLLLIPHTISVVAYDEAGNYARQDVIARKFL